MSIEPLRHDPVGVASYMDREHEALPAFHWSRELLQNALDAGATRVVFDGWTDDNGRCLARASDNGVGMNEPELVTHGRTLHLSGPNRTDNYGVGGRLATLSANPSGVTWASRSTDGDEFSLDAMVMLRRERGQYGIRKWEFADGTRDLVAAAVDGMLNTIGPDTGTAVILHGDGHRHTWNPSSAHGVATYLSRRYFRIPAEVTVDDGSKSNRLVPFGDDLARNAQTSGQITVDDEGSTAHWFVLRPSEERTRSKSYPVAGIAARVEDELFDMIVCTDRRTRYGQFGILGKTAKSRVAIIVVPGFDVRMTTSRASLVRAGGEPLPWDAWGEAFLDQLPEEIRSLTQAAVNDSGIDEHWLKQLDPEWFKLIAATPTRVSDPDGDLGYEVMALPLATGQPDDLEEGGEGTEQAGTATPPQPRPVGKDGPAKGRDRKSHQVPTFEFMSDEEWDQDDMLFAYYNRPKNVVVIRREAMEFDAVAGRYATQFPALAGEPLRAMVLNAYGTEAAAKVMHVLVKERGGWLSDWVDHALSAEGLSFALLGMNSIDRMIRDRCREVMAGR